MPRQFLRSEVRDAVSGSDVSRRELIGRCVAGAIALPFAAVVQGEESKGISAVEKRGAASRNLELDQDWLFAAEFDEAGLEIEFDDKALTRVTLPHSRGRTGIRLLGRRSAFTAATLRFHESSAAIELSFTSSTLWPPPRQS
jgi:hypothetical protein